MGQLERGGRAAPAAPILKRIGRVAIFYFCGGGPLGRGQFRPFSSWDSSQMFVRSDSLK